MAERRMFAKSIVMSDAFLDMPMSSRCLYFTLGMFADDDGFVNSPKSIMRQIGASLDDMNVLISKKFILAFDDGIVVIKHWRINNYLRSDRYKETTYLDEKRLLQIEENGAYTMSGIPLVDQRCTNGIPSIGKDSKEKDSIGEDIDGRSAPADLESAMEEFSKFRKAMKKPLTDKAKELILKDLEKFAPGDTESQVAILNQSIKRGWIGVFPLKEDIKGKNVAVSNDPNKWLKEPTFMQAIADLKGGM